MYRTYLYNDNVLTPRSYYKRQVLIFPYQLTIATSKVKQSKMIHAYLYQGNARHFFVI